MNFLYLPRTGHFGGGGCNPSVVVPGHYYKKNKKRDGSKHSRATAMMKAQEYTQPHLPQDVKKHSGGTAHDSSGSDVVATPSPANENQQQPQHLADHKDDISSQHREHSSEKQTPPATSSRPQQQAEYYAELSNELADDLATKVTARVNHNLQKSPFLLKHQTALEHVPTFRMDEDFCRLDLLGSGGFASVYEINLLGPERVHGHTPDTQYVVKHLSARLSDEASNKHKKLYLGAKDIVVESHLLAALDHPNILKLKGYPSGGASAFSTLHRTDAYFMVLPKLTCTLADKISLWKRRQEHSHVHSMESIAQTSLVDKPSGSSTNSWAARRQQRRKSKEAHHQQENTFFCERLQIIVDLLKALEYLHDRRIMHRDIKSSNIGFDQEGCLKLFDLGLAKEVPADSKFYYGESNHKPQVSLTCYDFSSRDMHLGNTGTPRQMAPEVIRREPYNCKVDVFATSIVSWELLMLKKPYGADVSGQHVKECVAIYGDRPAPIPRKWPKLLKKVIQQGWTRNVQARPTSHEMRESMEGILALQQRQQQR